MLTLCFLTQSKKLPVSPCLYHIHLAEVRAGNFFESPGPEIDAETRVTAPDNEDATLDPPDLTGPFTNDVHTFPWIYDYGYSIM